jgi:hypothetical protein
VTEMPPGRPSEPRTGPAAPAPAHDDGPTGPSTPTGRTALRDRIADALTREHYRRARERIEASPEDHCAAFADAVMPIVEDAIAQYRMQVDDPDSLLTQLAQARDAIADERRGRLAAEAAVRRVREMAENEEERVARGFGYQFGGKPFPASILTRDVLAALDAEQPKETP